MATIHVNASAAPGGDGTSAATAFRTISQAVTATAGGDTVRVAGGIYRETVYLDGSKSGSAVAPTRILGDAADPFVISGGEPLPGLVPCTAGDAAVAGPNWPRMYKTTLARSFFPGDDPNAGNLCEGGVQMTLAAERANRSDTFFLSKPAYYHVADTVQLSGADILGFRKPSVTDSYTKTQLDRCRVYFVAEPNKSIADDVVFDTATKTIRFAGGGYVYENNSYKDSFALFNLIPAMRAGEWGYAESGPDVTIYVWPTTPANVADGLIEYAARSRCIHTDDADHFEIADFVARTTGAPYRGLTQCAVYLKGGEFGHLRNFLVKNTYSVAGGAYAAVMSDGTTDLHLHDFKIERAQGLFGMYLVGSNSGAADWPYIKFSGSSRAWSEGEVVTGVMSGARTTPLFQYWSSDGTSGRYYYEPESRSGDFLDGEALAVNGQAAGTCGKDGNYNDQGDAAAVNQSLRGRIHDFEIDYVSSASIRAFTIKDWAIHHGLVHHAAEQSHGNTINFYQGCHNCLVWGLNGQGSEGYYTWQESDGIVLAFCAASANGGASGGARAIFEQQNRYSELPGVAYGWKPSAVINCRTIPTPERASETRYGNSLNVSNESWPENKFYVNNNIYHGHDGEKFVGIIDWDYNINTALGKGTGTVGANDVVQGWDVTYVDAGTSDFRYLPTAGIRSKAGKNLSSMITDFKARWPHVPADVFTRDMVGDTIDWSNPPIGPTVNLDVDYRTARGVEAPSPPPPPAIPASPRLLGRRMRLSVKVA